MTEGVEDLEVAIGSAVLELEAEVITRVVLVTAAKLDGEGGGKVG
jgi:hypothetical protein